MANRAWHRHQGGLEIGVVHLYAKVTIGANGAPTLSRGKGIASVSRVGAGNYKLVLEDKFNSLLWAGAFTLEDATLAGDTVGGNFWKIDSEDVAGASATQNIVFAAPATDDGADAEVADGAVVYFKIELSNSSVG